MKNLPNVNVIWFSKENYPGGGVLPPHRHGIFHYIFVLNGTAKVKVGETSYGTANDCFFATPPKIRHSIDSIGRDGLHVIEVKFYTAAKEITGSLMKLSGMIPTAGNAFGFDFRNNLEELVMEGMSDYNLPYRREIINARFLIILLNLLRMVFGEDLPQRDGKYIAADRGTDRITEHGTDSGKDRSAAGNDIINQTVGFVSRNYDQDIGLNEMAKNVKLSKYYFCRLFKNSVGKTPIKFLTDFRLNKAKELMLYSNLNITELALTAGFADASYFSRLFRQREKMSPREYMSKFKGNLYFQMETDKTDKIEE